MDLTRVIVGPIVTEKSERLKADTRHTYTMQVHPSATKIDIKGALRRFYDIEVESVRVMRVRAKRRSLGGTDMMEKRHAMKKALVTLKPKSKPLDLASFRANP